MTVDATLAPDQANAMLAGAFSDEDTPAGDRVVIEQPKIAPPPELSVTLLVGLVNQLTGTAEREARVRELTGADEEALTSPSLATSTAKYLGTLTARGTESIGGRKPSAEELDGLLIGDREMLLLAIRRATYGDDLELTTRCPHCDAVDDTYVYDLTQIPVSKSFDLESAQYGFQMDLPSGKSAYVSMPTVATQTALLEAGTDKGIGELNTLMLTHTVKRISEEPILGAGAVKALSIRDRNAILAELRKRTVGPQIGEAKRTCGACEKEFSLELGLLDLFRA